MTTATTTTTTKRRKRKQETRRIRRYIKGIFLLINFIFPKSTENVVHLMEQDITTKKVPVFVRGPIAHSSGCQFFDADTDADADADADQLLKDFFG